MNKTQTTRKAFRDQELEKVLPHWEEKAGWPLKMLIKAAGFVNIDYEIPEDISSKFAHPENVKKLAMKNGQNYITVTINEITNSMAPLYFWVDRYVGNRKILSRFVTKSRSTKELGVIALEDMREITFEDGKKIELHYIGKGIVLSKDYPSEDSIKTGLDIWIKCKDYTNGYSNLQLERDFSKLEIKDIPHFDRFVKEDLILDPWSDYDVKLANTYLKDVGEHFRGEVKMLYRKHFSNGKMSNSEFVNELDL